MEDISEINTRSVLYEQGYRAAPFFVVISGKLEVVQPSVPVETLVTIYEPGQFTGEVGTLSGRRTIFRVPAAKPGKVIELDRQQMLVLIYESLILPSLVMLVMPLSTRGIIEQARLAIHQYLRILYYDIYLETAQSYFFNYTLKVAQN